MREHARNKRALRMFILFIILVLVFVLGFAIRSNAPLMEALGVVDDAASNRTNITNSSKTKTTYDALSARISEVEDILSTYSMDGIDLPEATMQMLQDLMTSTNDPYAAYFSSERYESYIAETADRNYSGIGVLFGDYDGRAYAIDVLDGSEAQAKGVQQGDFIEAIDGDSSHKWSTLEVIGSLARDDGDNVIITWIRPKSLDATRGTEFNTKHH